MSAHSPGPWRASQGLIFDANGDVVLSFVREANAPLIAAAPELLELLKEYAEVDMGTGIYPRAAALIVRIEGKR